jgi:serine protease Do
MRKTIVLLTLLLVGWLTYSLISKSTNPAIQNFLHRVTPTVNVRSASQPLIGGTTKVVTEESVTVDAVKKIGPSVVTVQEVTNPAQAQSFDLGPMGMGMPSNQSQNAQPQAIGSGFILSADGLIVTNKHVVSDTQGKYQVITADDKKYDVSQIYRDPLNDIALIKINPAQNSGENLLPVTLGDSSNLQVGQFAIAIGTALGEFRNTVTTGVISGLGRGIQAGDDYAGYVEQLDNVIQTSAPINPGNSGGPLVNSSAQVIGINTAIAQRGQNIGFALPINVVKASVQNFNATGQFNRPFLGVSHKFIPSNLAILNDVPTGAYVQSVVADSAAAKAGVQVGDIIVKIDGTRLDDANNSLIALIGKKKVGDTITLSIWRNGKTLDLQATLTAASQ